MKYSLSNRINGTTTTQRMVRQYLNEVEGTIESIEEEQNRKGFVFREFVIMDEEIHPQPIPFQLSMRSVNLINSFKVGDRVKVIYRLKCNRGTAQYEGRIFINLEVLSIERASINEIQTENFKLSSDDQINGIDEDIQF